TVGAAYGMSPEETDDLIKHFCACSGYYFVDKLSTAEAAKRNPRCQEYLSVFDSRSRSYHDELYSLNIPGLWKTFSGNTLLLWGESAFIAAREDHQILADAINHYHAGHATFRTIRDAAHDMTVAASFAEARIGIGGYNHEVGLAVLSWLMQQSS